MSKAINPLPSLLHALNDFTTSGTCQLNGASTSPQEIIAQLATFRDQAVEAVPLIIKAHDLCQNYVFEYADGRNSYCGQDLLVTKNFIESLKQIASGPDLCIPFIESHLKENHKTQYYAAPGASPDPDKYDRDKELEENQDDLVQACLNAIAVFIYQRPQLVSINLLKELTSNRSSINRFLADNVLKLTQAM